MNKPFGRLLTYLRPYKKEIGISFIAMLLFSACNMAVIPIVARISEAIGNKNFAELNQMAFLVLAVYFFRGVATYAQGYLMNFVGYRVVTDLRLQVYKHIQDLSLDFFAKWRTGEIISRLLSDIQNIQTSIAGTVTETAPNLITLVGVLAYLFYLNWSLTLITLILIPILGWTITYFGKEMREASHSAQSKVADVSSILQEKISGIRVIKSFAMEKHEIEQFKKENENNFWLIMKQAQIYVTQAPILSFIQMGVIVGLIWYGGVEVVSGRISPANLIAFFTGIALLADPVSKLGSISTSIQGAMASADRIFEIIDIIPTVREKENPLPLVDVKGSVEFKNVSFAYDSKKEILSDVNLKASPGEVVAIVGRSGAGKSSLVNLIPRFYDVTNGSILIDGIEIKDVKLFDLRSVLGIVPQETFLFSGSIRDNIAYAKISATDEEIIACAKMANAHDFITGLPDGYQTLVGERGVRLSGGEKQRVAIARSLLRNPKILIFDEATSSLDTESESLVQDAIKNMMKGRTTFVIAHRLSTVQNADKIIVLDNGKIVEDGDHNTLLAKNGIYRKLYEIQFRDEG